MRGLTIFSDRKIRNIDLVYSGHQANHSSGFYFDLDNFRASFFAFCAYKGFPDYELGSSRMMFSETYDIENCDEILPQNKALIGFFLSQLREKIGCFSSFKAVCIPGEMVFFPFPIKPEEQEEAAYAEDLFQAQEALTDIARTNFLLGAIPELVEDQQKQTENAEKRKKILNKKRAAEEKLTRLNADYQTTTETLIATLEGKLISRNEAEYQQMVADEQAKISAQLQKRSQPGIMAGKKLSRREKEQAKKNELAEKNS